MKWIITLVVAVSFWATNAVAGEECTGMTQSEMNQCVASDYKASDQKLNMTWIELRVCKINSPEEWALIVKSQKAWIQLKESQCELEAGLDWGIELRGSGWPLTYFSCMTEMTEERTAFLGTLFTDCYEHSEPGEM